MLVSDPALADADTLATARALAAAIRKIGVYDIVVAGRNSIDGMNAAVGVQTAALLGIPMLSFVAALKQVNAGDKRITVVRSVDGGKETLSAALPAVISVVKEIAEPRYPSFMGIRKAAKAPITTWGLADLGLSADEVAPQVTWTTALPSVRETNAEMLTGTPQEMAAQLFDKLIAAKAI